MALFSDFGALCIHPLIFSIPRSRIRRWLFVDKSEGNGRSTDPIHFYMFLQSLTLWKSICHSKIKFSNLHIYLVISKMEKMSVKSWKLYIMKVVCCKNIVKNVKNIIMHRAWSSARIINLKKNTSLYLSCKMCLEWTFLIFSMMLIINP